MKEYISKGIICIKDKFNLIYHLCVITYKLYEDESFEYVFEPNYNVVDLLPTNFFDTLPGLDFSLRKKEYIRKNMVPTFVSERVIPESREDYYDLLKERDMEYMEPIIYMIRSKKQYSGDKLFVVEYEEKQIVNIDINNKQQANISSCIKDILVEICKGNNIKIGDSYIDDTNRKQVYDLLYALYSKSMKYNKQKQLEGIEKAKKENKYRGRKPVKIEKFRVLLMAEKVKKDELTSKQAAKELGISIDKYYRVLRELRNNNDTLLQNNE